MKRPLESYFEPAKWWVIAIILVGTIRILLTTMGFPNELVKFASMTVIMAIGSVYLAVWSAWHDWNYRDLFVFSYFITVPYMAVEVVGLSLAGLSGQMNIFHTREYSFGAPLWLHLTGHIIGGLTWEPWTIWLICCVVFWLTVKMYGKAADTRV
ncbi:MAG TPA: hypothetical protein VGQ81_04735 [Acidobacteriota bacterium]|jgi:small basic protein|nr:hypothetical protein [Acidobacteriota bacterium]